MVAKRMGHVFIISAASGTGKTTLVSRIVNHHPDIRVSVSHTTRAPREGEQHGKHYYFISKEKFLELVGQGAFLEHAQVFDHYYGTSAMVVEDIRKQGMDVILEIDVQGAMQIRKLLPQATSIFILPPSFRDLEARLRKRATDSEAVIAQRLSEARHEIQHALEFDYVLSNHDLVETESNLLHIIKAQRFRQPAQIENIEKVLQSI